MFSTGPSSSRARRGFESRRGKNNCGGGVTHLYPWERKAVHVLDGCFLSVALGGDGVTGPIPRGTHSWGAAPWACEGRGGGAEVKGARDRGGKSGEGSWREQRALQGKKGIPRGERHGLSDGEWGRGCIGERVGLDFRWRLCGRERSDGAGAR